MFGHTQAALVSQRALSLVVANALNQLGHPILSRAGAAVVFVFAAGLSPFDHVCAFGLRANSEDFPQWTLDAQELFVLTCRTIARGCDHKKMGKLRRSLLHSADCVTMRMQRPDYWNVRHHPDFAFLDKDPELERLLRKIEQLYAVLCKSSFPPILAAALRNLAQEAVESEELEEVD